MEDGFFSGQFLIAMPGIGDPRFERAVILLCEHDPAHAMGLTVNRPVEGLAVADLLGRLGVEPGPDAPPDLVLMGGPVEPERGFVLHTRDKGAIDNNGVAIGGLIALAGGIYAVSRRRPVTADNVTDVPAPSQPVDLAA